MPGAGLSRRNRDPQFPCHCRFNTPIRNLKIPLVMTTPANARFDVLGLGCTAIDDLLYIPSFPQADEKVRVQERQRKFGGLIGAALVAAARAGAACAYAGCLGTDEFSAAVEACLDREGINTAHAPRLPDAGVIHSTIVVGRDTGSRNIFYETGALIGAHDTLPAAEVISNARVLAIDHYGMPGNLRAARIARAAGRSVVADFEDSASPLFTELLGLVDHLILGEKFACQLTGTPDAARAAGALWPANRAVVIVTAGTHGCWCLSSAAESAPRHFPAFPIHPQDTTGCGDVFHGAYAASLARGEDLATRIRFASAAAALKAELGGIPRLDQLQAFLASSMFTQQG